MKAAFLATKIRGAWVTIMGPPGIGKTWQAWGVYRHSRATQLRRYIAATEDTEERRDRAALKTPRVLILAETEIAAHRFDYEWLRNIAEFRGLVVIDDLGAGRKADDWKLDAIYVIASERRAHGRACMWTTNIDREALAIYYTPGIASRVLGGEVIESHKSDRRQAGKAVTS